MKRTSIGAHQHGLNLPLIDTTSNLFDVKKPITTPTAGVSFNFIESFDSILHNSNRHRTEHRPARVACAAARVSLSRSVSPQRRSVIRKPSGKQWEEWEPVANTGPSPEPVRIEPPASMELLSLNKRGDPGKLADYQTRARVCRRAGRDQAEADALYNVGVLCEGNEQMQAALAAYRRHFEVCSKRNNKAGKAIACNSIAAVYQKQGELGNALKYHHMHLDYADVPGTFVAHTNLGCIYASLGELSVAMQHHQHALRYGIRMESQSSQAIAVNNLGITGGLGGDLYTAKACMERFLELSSETHNTVALGIAYAHLADITMMNNDLPQASQLYSHARRIARSTGNRKAFTYASIQMGIVTGQIKFEHHMMSILDRCKLSRVTDNIH